MTDDKIILKKKLYDLCKSNIAKKIEDAKDAIESLQIAANEETKSSFGDKYETGRAMVQLEIEKYALQLSEANKLRNTLDRIDVGHKFDIVQSGSVAITDHGNYFLAVSGGQLEIDSKKFLAISSSSPIGTRLLNLKPADQFSFNNQTYRILDVY